MSDDTPSDPDWAERYLHRRLGEGSDRTVPDSVPPEAAEYMDGLAAGAATLSATDRARYLETAVRALVAALADEDAPAGVATERAAAFVGDETVVVVDEALGELISVDRETAALVAFAHDLDPEATD